MRKRSVWWLAGFSVFAFMWLNAWMRTSSASKPLNVTASPSPTSSAVLTAPADGPIQRPTRSVFESAQLDPFGWMPPPPKPVAVSAPPAPPPPPPPPPVNLKVVGKMTLAPGQTMIYAMEGNRSLTLTQGMTLASGHFVVKLNETSIELAHPLLSQAVVLPIPAAPKHEIR